MTSTPSVSDRPAVHATGLVKAFGATRAVDGIDLDIPAGQVYGVLGPNGAGKTTMLRMLATLLAIDAGQAHVFGVDVARHPHLVRQLLGVTGQYAAVDENLTGAENLWLFGRLQQLTSRQARRRATDLLDQFGLTDAADKRVSAYSGGMRRRLDLAVGLITQPPLIFLDEPTTGLDPRTRGQMWTTIRELVSGGATVLLTTQYLDEADQLADRIAVIDHGRMVAEGTPEELKNQVGTSTLQVRLADPGQLGRAATAIEAVVDARPVLSPEAAELAVPLTNADQAAAALIVLREQGLSIASASVSKPTLDEVFLTLTGRPTGEPRPEPELPAHGEPGPQPEPHSEPTTMEPIR